MSKKFADVKFTAGERAAIDVGFRALQDIADRTGSSGAAYLAKALMLETSGPDGVTTNFAKGLICEWFYNSIHAKPTLASLYGRREASILLAILNAAAFEHRNAPNADEMDLIWLAARSKTDAFNRRRALDETAKI